MINKINLRIVFSLFFLILFGFIFQKSFIFGDINPLIIIENHDFNKQQPHFDFINSNKLSGEFTSRNDHLGIISLKFNTHFHVNNDYLLFSIKEKGQSVWQYSVKYKVDQFQNGEYFPFGFPEITNSRGKVYEIEVQSLNGNPNKIISLYENSQFLSKHVFTKDFLKHDPKQIPVHILNKVISLFYYLNIYEYLSILTISIILCLTFRSKSESNFYKYIVGSIKVKSISNKQKIILGFLIQIALILFVSLTVVVLKKHNEGSEWIIYEICSIISFLVLVLFNIRSFVNTKIFNKTIIISTLLFLFLSIFFCFHSNNSYQYLILTTLAFIPAIIYFQKNPENFFLTLFINLISIFSICAYFTSDIDNISFFGFIILVLTLLTLFRYFSKSTFVITLFTKRQKIKSYFILLIFLVLSLITFFLIRNKSIEYHHYSFYIGPAYEISYGKSIINEVPSQYGYLSIHFINLLLKNIGITFQSFHILNIILFTVYFSLTFLIFNKITKNILLSILLFVFSLSFQTQFSIYNSVLAPSTGPLRFGIGALIILLLLYLPKKMKFVIPSILSAISLFWSMETTIYIVPAWIFLLLAYSYVNSSNLKSFFIHFLKKFGLFLIFTLSISFIIFLKEKTPTNYFPQIQNYVQFVTTYKDGFGAELIPLFGNYYPVILITILGFSLSIFSIFKKYKQKIHLTLYFISVHNIAIFSYFIGRSHENNIVNISLFYLIELVICLKIICTIFPIKSQKIFFLKYLFFPISIFTILFFTRIYLNISIPTRLQVSPPKIINYIDKYELLKQKYHLNPNNVLVISREDDCPIIIKNKIKTILPLNPSRMIILLPNYQQKYILPNLSKLKIGTTIVATDDFSELMEILQNNLTLKKVSTNSADFFNVYTVFSISPPKRN